MRDLQCFQPAAVRRQPCVGGGVRSATVALTALVAGLWVVAACATTTTIDMTNAGDLPVTVETPTSVDATADQPATGSAATDQREDAAAATSEPGGPQATSSADEKSESGGATPLSTVAPQPTPTMTAASTSAQERIAPRVATDPESLAAQISAGDAGARDLSNTLIERQRFGHLHQVAIRALGYRPEWDARVFAALPQNQRATTTLHLNARRALIGLHSGYDAADFIPAWRIVDPEPADALMSYYQAAEQATGIEWEYLAAINLIETGIGRIRGLSSAGAQGPMQFLPTTWDEAGIGEGDINDPSDAIHAAARYLVRRGGPADMQGALWGYNNSDDYVTAVQAYAELLRQEPEGYQTIWNWEIYFFTEAGDIWLPSGFESTETLNLDEFLAANPRSAPDVGIRPAN